MIVRYTRIAAPGWLTPPWRTRLWPRRRAEAARLGAWESEGGALRPDTSDRTSFRPSSSADPVI